MSVLYLVVPLAILIVLAALLAYTWAARHGQFDDLDTPALRMLNDDAPGRRSEERRASPRPDDRHG